MSTEIWCLLFNDKKELLRGPLSAKASHIDGLTMAIEERCSHLDCVKALDLVVWRCKEPTLLSTQDDDELQDYLLEIDFHDKKQVIKLASGAETADLELGQKEVLLVQVLGAISNFICSQLRSLAATNLGSKKQKLEEESPSTNLIKGENRNFFTV